MAVCTLCTKKSHMRSWSRHKKGSSGASGTWALRAPISKKPQNPNLHTFKNQKYCTKCLRMVKSIWNIEREAKALTSSI